MNEPATRRPGLLRRLSIRRIRDRDAVIYGVLLLVAIAFPSAALFATGSTALIAQAGHAGTYVLLAIGLNVVVGFAGLLDLGYAAFFAIGAYTYALFASSQLGASPLHHSFHLPFWLMIFVGMFVAAAAGRSPRLSDAPAPRRLPRHRDPRLRRDRAAALVQPSGLDRWHQRDRRHRPAEPALLDHRAHGPAPTTSRSSSPTPAGRSPTPISSRPASASVSIRSPSTC